jgi:hypothetical protein
MHCYEVYLGQSQDFVILVCGGLSVINFCHFINWSIDFQSAIIHIFVLIDSVV